VIRPLVSRLNAFCLRGHHAVLFVGDSHVAFAGRHALGVSAAFAGVPGDDVNAVRRRIARGEFRRITCDTLVVVLGANEIAPWCGAETAAARVFATALLLGDATGATRILLHGMFAHDAFNRALARLADQCDTFYLPPPGDVSREPDGVHLDAAGYGAWMDWLRYAINLADGRARTLPRWFWRAVDALVTLKQTAHA
jgi:hypothetical protein